MILRNKDGVEIDTDNILFGDIDYIDGVDFDDFVEFILDQLERDCQFQYIDKYLKTIGYRVVVVEE